jgi:SAM-dependent methyltransferase
MNLAETTFINSTLRVRELRNRIGPDVLDRSRLDDVGRVLEVGCGQGIGLSLLADRFPNAQIVGVDLDPGMIRRAGRRVAALGDRVELRVDDLSSLPDPPGSFDVVVDFAAVHHVPDWRSALSEIARALRAGGEFLFEDHDVTKHSWFARHFFAHPEERFTAAEFVDALKDVGIDVGDDIDDRNGHFVGRGTRQPH